MCITMKDKMKSWSCLISIGICHFILHSLDDGRLQKSEFPLKFQIESGHLFSLHSVPLVASILSKD